MKFRIIVTTTIALLLMNELTGCIGKDVPSNGHSSNDPSHWVTRTWVDDEPKPQHVIIKTSKSSSPNWLASKLSVLAGSAMSNGNLMDRLPNGYQMQHYTNSPEVQAQIRWFMNHQAYLNHTTQRSAPYIYYIHQQVQRRNLPTELVLLPIIESAYNPFNLSNRGAAGLWQLMPATGSDWGVKQNWWYDGRRDIFASTNAALDYLTYLQNYFDGNWLLALAAYNCGPGAVQAAIRKNIRMGRPTDFWSLPLPQETRAYVPRLLALASIIQERDRYQIYLPPVADHPYLAQVDVGSQIDLSHAAKLAGMNLKELHSLNPGFNHTATDPGGPYMLILPVDKIDIFKQNLSMLAREEKLSYQPYRVKHGETLASIADHFDTTPSKIKEINHLHGRYVKPGRSLLVPILAMAVSDKPQKAPTHSEAIDNLIDAAATQTNGNNTELASSDENSENEAEEIVNETMPKNPTESLIQNFIDTTPPIKNSVSQKTVSNYKVQRGDTLYKISRQFNVPANELSNTNHLKRNQITPGMVLKIPGKPELVAPKQITHQTKPKKSSAKTTHLTTTKQKNKKG